MINDLIDIQSSMDACQDIIDDIELDDNIRFSYYMNYISMRDYRKYLIDNIGIRGVDDEDTYTELLKGQ